MKCTLKKWQTLHHDLHDIIFNASAMDGSDSWTPFPIGVAHNLFPLLVKHNGFLKGAHQRLFHCSFLLHTDQDRRKVGLNRRMINDILAKKGIPNFQYSPENYFKSLANSKFVISPEGNGIDCHRTYEALLAGCIPICEENPSIREKYHGLPVLYTKDFSDLAQTTLEMRWKEMLDKEYDFSRLFISSYPKEIQEQIKQNGNYWLRKTGASLFDFYSIQAE